MQPSFNLKVVLLGLLLVLSMIVLSSPYKGVLKDAFCMTFLSANLSCTKEHIGETFHHLTKGNTPPTFILIPKKDYGDRITLPQARIAGNLSHAIVKRRSIREYTEEPITLQELSDLLFAAQGITGEKGGRKLRSAPSAGALYPIEIYVVANRIEGLEKGIYHYNPEDHSISLVSKGDFSQTLFEASRQRWLRDASAVFIYTAVFGRTTQKYGSRGYRYVYMEIGHASQNLLLAAVNLGLGCVPVGGFRDDVINDMLGIDGHTEAVVYTNAVGRI